MTQQTQDGSIGRRRGVAQALLYLALLASGIFAAWQIHVWWADRERPAGSPSMDTFRADPAQAAGDDAQDISRGLRSGSLAGLERLKSDPGDIAPPAGAVRLHCFVRNIGPEDQQVARYDLQGTIQASAEYYLQMLPSRGYKLLSDRDSQGRRSLILADGRTTVSLLLEKKVSQVDVVSIVLVLTCPASRPASLAASRPK